MNGGGGSHNMHDMGGDSMGMPPADHDGHQRHRMMHMTFFWGKNTEILFDGWPGFDHSGMYILALVVLFFLAFIVEWLSHCKYFKESSDRVGSGLMQTLLYAIRIGLAYLVMLAVMSFNGGVFLAVVAGHTVGFSVFGSRIFKKQSPPAGFGKITSELPSTNC